MSEEQAAARRACGAGVLVGNGGGRGRRLQRAHGHRWLRRWREEGERGLVDRSSAPHSIPHRTSRDCVEAIEKLRRLFLTAAEIAEVLGMALSTVSAVIKPIGLGKRSRLSAPEPPRRYERKRAGELVHLDIKKIGRISARGAGHRVTGNRASRHQATVAGKRRRVTGWEFVHVAVDDATRLAYVEVLDDEKAATAVGFLRRAVAFFRRYGIRVERVLTDNGACYRAVVHALACRALGIKHLRTRPYRPRTNGKAERFIRTLTNGWAYGAVYRTSAERSAALAGWLDWYNRRRPHRSLGRKPPLTRLGEMNNLVGTNT